MSLNPTGIYQDLLDGYFGNLDAIEQRDIWTRFLTKNMISDQTALDDVENQKRFARYIENTYLEIDPVQLSDQEIQGRRLVFTIFDILIELMRDIAENVGVLQENIVLLAKYQEQYTREMARITFYKAESPDTASPDTTDLTKWTLGYANITMAEYIETAIVKFLGEADDTSLILWADSATTPEELTQDVGFPFGVVTKTLTIADFGSLAALRDSFAFRMGEDSGGTFLSLALFTKVLKSVFIGAVGEESDPSKYELQLVQHVQEQKIYFDPGDTFQDMFEKAQEGFIQFLDVQVSTTDRTVGDYLTNPDVPFRIRWPRSPPINTPYDEDHAGADFSSAANRRATKNSLLNQYIENARTRREIIANQQDSEETTLDQAKDALARSAEIINTAIHQLQNILASIFKIV